MSFKNVKLIATALSGSLLVAGCAKPAPVIGTPKIEAPEAARPCVKRPSWMEPSDCQR